MNSITQAMIVAKELVDVHGDNDKFYQQYLLVRENRGILYSLKCALEQQDLWGMFVDRSEVSFLERHGLV